MVQIDPFIPVINEFSQSVQVCWLSLLQGLHYELQNCPELKTLAKIMGCSISIGDFETKNLNAFSGIIPKASLDGYL